MILGSIAVSIPAHLEDHCLSVAHAASRHSTLGTAPTGHMPGSGTLLAGM